MRTLRVPVLLKDRLTEMDKGFEPCERREIRVASLLPGPISDRVAVVDLRQGGVLAAPLPVPAHDDDLLCRSGEPYRDPTAIRWSVFATILETLELFESRDCLGREIPWAFGRSQILVVPEAGKMGNAYYERESQSLQFFYIDADGGGTISTAASHDIVAHETGHAILDGIAPWLYDASSPESLAIHESVGDLTALFAAASSASLMKHALEMTGGDLRKTWLFSSLAREIGRGVGYEKELRSLVDDPGRLLALRHFADDAGPHELSVVLSRAFYALLLDIYEARHGERLVTRTDSRAQDLRLSRQQDADPFQQRILALVYAVSVVKRILFRGLDYLPPGDVGFLDLARAVLACDRASHPEDSAGVRELLAARLIERGIGQDTRDLETPHEALAEALGMSDLDAIERSTWHSMRLVEGVRDLLEIPKDTPFDVLPRLRVDKLLRVSGGQAMRSELLLKVSWREREEAGADGPAAQRWVRQGATIAFDGTTGRTCAFVRTSTGRQRLRRDAFVSRLMSRGQLAPKETGEQGSRDPWEPIRWSSADGAYELHGAMRTLHFLEVRP